MMQQTRQDGVEAANMLIILRSRWMPQLPQSYSLYSCPTFNAHITRNITSLGNIQYVYVNIYTEHNTQVKLHYRSPDCTRSSLESAPPPPTTWPPCWPTWSTAPRSSPSSSATPRSEFQLSEKISYLSIYLPTLYNT